MPTREEDRAQYALERLAKGSYVEPGMCFVGDSGEGAKLYKLEAKRNDIVEACAKQWGVVANIDKSRYWLQLLPQALHDLLEAYELPCGILAAEAFLKRYGWKIERPAVK